LQEKIERFLISRIVRIAVNAGIILVIFDRGEGVKEVVNSFLKN
jgi:hypothetical protein